MAASSPHFSLVDWVRPPWTGSVSIAGPADRRRGRSTRGPSSRCWPGLRWARGSSPRTEAGGCYGSPANVARRERARALARERGWTPAQVALAYLFSQPFPVSAVVAASTGEKMRENLAAAALRLTAREVEALEG